MLLIATDNLHYSTASFFAGCNHDSQRDHEVVHQSESGTNR